MTSWNKQELSQNDELEQAGVEPERRAGTSRSKARMTSWNKQELSRSDEHLSSPLWGQVLSCGWNRA